MDRLTEYHFYSRVSQRADDQYGGVRESLVAVKATNLTAVSLRPYLERCGYRESRLAADYSFDGTFDYFHKDLFNPESMTVAVLELSSRTPTKGGHWAAMALNSLIAATAYQPAALGELV
ncbi:MAG: hypothetical protein IIA66_10130, partial [Planctomycetes bacterium]|nr:hypothetical protein [Planctomycetota bacterium]